jgi:hypothetical protein
MVLTAMLIWVGRITKIVVCSFQIIELRRALATTTANYGQSCLFSVIDVFQFLSFLHNGNISHNSFSFASHLTKTVSISLLYLISSLESSPCVATGNLIIKKYHSILSKRNQLLIYLINGLLPFLTTLILPQNMYLIKNLFQITGQLIKLKFATYKSSLFIKSMIMLSRLRQV